MPGAAAGGGGLLEQALAKQATRMRTIEIRMITLRNTAESHWSDQTGFGSIQQISKRGVNLLTKKA